MRIVEDINAARQAVREARQHGLSVGLVPTMGALHEGHLTLIRRAAQETEFVVVSIFVNPLQFGPSEDLSKYPREFDQDLDKLQSLPVSLIFHPEVSDMYPEGPSRTLVTVPGLNGVLCGLTRPSHFDGVATVVSKLFHILEPDVAVFGQKDAQQLAIIRRLVHDLNFPVQIIGAPIVREPGGLALSSRNQYLSAEEKIRARAIYQSLQSAEAAFRQGERHAEVLTAVVRKHLQRYEIGPEYVEIVDPLSLQPVPYVRTPALLAVAARIGDTRLIDNILIGSS